MPPDTSITIGHVLRHAPAKGVQGYEAALIDTAQDLLLRDLHARGVADELAFKGGTALRKLYAGVAGRFSKDLDFSVRNPDREPSAVLDLMVAAIDGAQIGPFRFGIAVRRKKPHVTIETSLGIVETLTCRLDVNPPPWLHPERRGWVPMPIHEHYGGPLPELQVVRIEENIAEKIARLNRATPTRDAYDLVWIMENRRDLGRALDIDLIRRLAVMKAWVDMNGLRTSKHTWKKGHEPLPLDVERWLRQRSRSEFDDEDIGLLATPPPALDELSEALSREYGFLQDLLPDEQILARCHGGDRRLLLHALDALPGTQMVLGTCW